MSALVLSVGNWVSVREDNYWVLSLLRVTTKDTQALKR